MLLTLPSGLWEDALFVYCSGQNANRFLKELWPQPPSGLMPTASFYLTSTCVQASSPPSASFPMRPLRSLQAPANDITRVQPESQANDTEAQIWLDLKQSCSLKRQVAPFKIPLCPSASVSLCSLRNFQNICCGSSCPLPALARAWKSCCSQQLLAFS